MASRLESLRDRVLESIRVYPLGFEPDPQDAYLRGYMDAVRRVQATLENRAPHER